MKTICIRTDGNDKIATGHIQRCLSIARAIRGSDDSIISQTNVIFIVSDEKSKQLLEERFESECEFPVNIQKCDYARLSEEAGALFDCVSQLRASCLLIDSYQVTEDFFEKLHKLTKNAGITLAYIDDQQILNKYDIDVMINYSTVSMPASYMSVPVRLCGKRYTPLRKQFSECAYTVRDVIRDIFISSGGTDPYGISLILCEKLHGYNLHILTSSLNRDILKLRDLASSNESITVYEGVSDVASVMRKCDLGICAGGTTLGEVCAVGLPSVSYIIADNQRSGVMEFVKDDIIPCAGDCTKDPDGTLNSIISLIDDLKSKDRADREMISQKMRRYIDGTGAQKIAEVLLN